MQTTMAQNSNNCQNCGYLYPSGEQEDQREFRELIQYYIRTIGLIIRACIFCEEQYRADGLRYHKTQLDVRQDDELKGWYGMTDATANASRLPNLDAYIQQLLRLLSDAEHVPSCSSAHELYHKVTDELAPAVGAAHATLENHAEVFKAIENKVKEAEQASHQLIHRQLGTSWWTSVFDFNSGRYTVNKDAPEWAIFCNWVLSLPESRRSLKVGRNIEQIATELLLLDGDRFKEREEMFF